MIKENIFALDLGTTKFCIAGLLYNKSNSKPSIETVSVPSRGMRRGMLSDFQESEVALNNLLDIAEKQLNLSIDKVIVGIAGSHLKGRKATYQMDLIDHEVSGTDLNLLLKMALQRSKQPEREILHVIPIRYRVDRREYVDNPLGFSGTLLEGDYYIIDADQSYLKDVIRVCNHCGIEVRRLYSEPFASASVTVEEHQKQLGVAITDIGGGTSDGIVFQKGKPSDVFTVNIAGIMMTNDLAIGLNISQDEAEKVKRMFGLSPNIGNQTIDTNNLYGAPKTITLKEAYPILAHRIFELSQYVAKELMPYKGRLGAGLLLTGGGSEIKGITNFFSKVFNIPVNKAVPSLPQITTTDTQTKDKYSTKYATVLGLINLELGKINEDNHYKKVYWPQNYISQFVNWIKELS
ncbi:MAG: cell division protein FtsA [Oligoflexales bacterium]|nr:cell division protein FtsA [Oligoflexales bacterium]